MIQDHGMIILGLVGFFRFRRRFLMGFRFKSDCGLATEAARLAFGLALADDILGARLCAHQRREKLKMLLSGKHELPKLR